MRDVELSPDAAPVAREIYRRMKAAKLGQKALAQIAGVNDTYVRDILKAKSLNPKSEQLSKVAEALGCTLLDLTDPRPAGEVPPATEIVDDPDELAWLALWRRLTPVGRRRMLAGAAEDVPAPAKRPRGRKADD